MHYGLKCFYSYGFVCIHGGPVNATTYLEVRNNFQVSVGPFYHVGPADKTQAIKQGGKAPLMLSHPTGL